MTSKSTAIAGVALLAMLSLAGIEIGEAQFAKGSHKGSPKYTSTITPTNSLKIDAATVMPVTVGRNPTGKEEQWSKRKKFNL